MNRRPRVPAPVRARLLPVVRARLLSDVRARPLPDVRARALALVLPFALGLAPTAASAVPARETVPLPVLAEKLADGAPCAKGSGEVAKAVPWEGQALALARTRTLAQGAGVAVGVVDSGVSTGAPALTGRVTALGDSGTDCVGHGTFVAGLIAAAPADGVGFAGVAPQARIIAAGGTAPRGGATAPAVAAGIRTAVDAGARIITVSAAFPVREQAVTDAVGYARSRDVLVIAPAVPDSLPEASAGSGEPQPRAYWPAAEPGVLSVVDVDVQGARTKGAARPLRADLAAPGSGVIGTGPSRDGHYIGSGASLAAAYTAGAAALVRGAEPALDAAAVAARLTATAYPADVPRLDPYAAVTEAGGAPAGTPGPAAGAVTLPETSAAERAVDRSRLLAAAAAGLVLAVAWAAAAIPRARRRRAAGATAGPTPATEPEPASTPPAPSG
ncbi:S8 family serine peptidase [Streptomyces vinaceus]|uniref:S8 family serine peptidase n=1 Tax=Streptomyces vinaceus TaxID=1960 RepID=UPI0035DEBBA0